MKARFNPTIEDHGIFATHDMPCAVCFEHEEPAVYDCNRQIFQPSHFAQEQGWILIRCKQRWKRRLLYWFGLIGYFDIDPPNPQMLIGRTFF